MPSTRSTSTSKPGSKCTCATRASGRTDSQTDKPTTTICKRWHTSRMREICTSGSQEGRGSDGHWLLPLQPVLLAYSTVKLKPEEKVSIFAQIAFRQLLFRST